MKIFRKFEEISGLERSVVSVGNFDGVHRGHLRLLEVLRTTADQFGLPAVVMTFDPHPAVVLRGVQPGPINWLERKLDLLSQSGVDVVIAYPTDRELLGLSAETFFFEVLVGRLRTRAIVEGADFRFGRNRAGGVDLLESLCAKEGVTCSIVSPVVWAGETISSSRIRECLMCGEVAKAAELMSRPFRTCGEVVRGAGRGTSLGFPTANLAKVRTLLPKPGIYAGCVPLGRQVYPAAISLGGNPTFDETELKLEIYIIDFAGNLYGQQLQVDFLEYLREIKRFASAEDLIKQMSRDVGQTREIVKRWETKVLGRMSS
ncbi:MAG: bifunctional riboflavin kinase/FAD synthetase [Thermogutta sp.]